MNPLINIPWYSEMLQILIDEGYESSGLVTTSVEYRIFSDSRKIYDINNE